MLAAFVFDRWRVGLGYSNFSYGVETAPQIPSGMTTKKRKRLYTNCGLVDVAVEACREEDPRVWARAGWRGAGDDCENLLWRSGEADAVVVCVENGGRDEGWRGSLECDHLGVVDALIIRVFDPAVGGLGRGRGGWVGNSGTESRDLLGVTGERS